MSNVMENPFISALVRQKQEVDLKKYEFDVHEDRFDHIFSVKYSTIDNQILSYMSMPFDYEPGLNKKEEDAGNIAICKVGSLPREQVYIINDIDVQDVAQTIMFDPETKEVYDIKIQVTCNNEGSYFDDNKKMWILPLKTKKAEFEIVPVKNSKDPIDISSFYEFSVKSMEKVTSYMTINDEEGVKKIVLPLEKQTITANIIQDEWEQVIRVKLINAENSIKWLTHYICFKTKG